MQYLYADELFTLSLGSFFIPDKLLERVKRAFRSAAKFIHAKGSYNPDMLAEKPLKELLYATYDSLSDAVNIGLKKSDMPATMRLHLQDNTFMFSGFKTHAQMQQASRLLLDDDKNIKPFNQFLKDVQTIDKTYNGSYLQAEYNFAIHSAQSAAQWQEFVADADDFYLRYRTAGDERVREQHRLLDGITLPVEDKFWDEFFPPNGWNCRCSVIQVPKHSATPSSSSEAIAKGRSATYLPNSKGENKAKIFRFNPGKEQKIFPPKHPYFPKGCGDCKLKKYAYKKGNAECQACTTTQFIYKNDETIVKTQKGKVYWTERQDEELEENITTAVFLANTFGYKIKLLPKSNQHNVTTADTMNETLNVPQEYKLNTEGTTRSIEDSIRRGRKQAPYIVIRFDLEMEKEETINLIKNAIRFLNNHKGKDERNFEIEEVLVLFKDNDFKKIKRE